MVMLTEIGVFVMVKTEALLRSFVAPFQEQLPVIVERKVRVGRMAAARSYKGYMPGGYVLVIGGSGAVIHRQLVEAIPVSGASN